MRVLKTHDKLNKFGIPLGYTRVEYLESTGTQYIDTGYKAVPATTKFEVMFQCDDITDSTFIFGARPDTSATSQYTCATYKATSRIRQDWAGLSDFFTGITTTDKYIYTAYNNTITLNDTTVTGTITRSTNRLDYNFLLFTVNTGGTADSRRYVGKIYYAKLWDDGVLVRDFIPCLDIFGKPCLYDLVEHKTYYNQDSGDDFTVGRKIIPVEYLESTGTQYIDTGVNLNNNSSVEIDYQLTNATQNRKGLFGNLLSNMSARFGSLLSPSNNYLEHGYGNSNIYWQPGLPDTNRHKLYQKKNEIYFDNNLVHTFNEATFSISDTAPLGNFAFTNYNPASAKYYSSRWWDGETLVRDFIPCKDENNVGFMFDTVSGTVYENAGTGSFIVGEEAYDYKDTVRFLKDKIKYGLLGEYTRVEYIEAENNGNSVIQYAVSDYRLTNTTDWEITFSASSSGNNWVLGQPTWIGVHFRKDTSTSNLPRVGITNSAATASQCYVDYTENEKITLALKGTDVYANGVKVGSITRVSAPTTQTKYGIFAYKDINQALPNLRISSARIYEIKIWDNNVLVQHLLPVIDSNGEGCFYDMVNKTVIRKEDNCTSNFTTGNIIYGLRLLAGGSMDDYIFLDYLESTGTQWIDTGVNAKTGIKTELDMMWSAGSAGNTKYIFGAAGYYNMTVGTSSSSWVYGSFNNLSGGTVVDNIYYKVISSYEKSNQYLSINDTNIIIGTDARETDLGVNLGLFCRKKANGPEFLSSARLYDCKIWDNNTLIRNFLPALRKSDNKPGMYDMVEGKFYVNQNTGADFNYGYKQ